MKALIMRRMLASLMGLVLALTGPSAAESNPRLVSEVHDAVGQGDTDTVRRMLLEDPGLATPVAEFGFQPMQLQDLYFEEAILELLLANGAGINSANDGGTTLLHIISDPGAVPVLIARGAELEARDQKGQPP